MWSWREWRPSGRDSVATPVHGGEEEGTKVNSPWYNIVYIASDAYSVCFLIHCTACL